MFASINVMIIGDFKDWSWALTRESIYHECGHYINNDTKPYILYDLKLGKLSTPLASKLGLYTGYGLCISSAYFYLLKKKLHPTISLLAAIPLGLSTPFLLHTIYSKTIGNIFSKKRELAADIFAIKSLLAQNDFEAVLAWFLFCTNQMKNDFWESASIISSHPSSHQRALLVLKELKQRGINLKNIPFNLSEPEKEVMQKKVDKEILLLFPQFYQYK